ncbi:TetR family transcriptional regulator [Nocardia sp. SSK8]
MIELMIERGYDRVRVSDIIARANVGRSTFHVPVLGDCSG